MDLHLQQGSPCIGNGFSGTDIGAYGGAGADTIPFIISGVALSSPSSGSVSVDWSPNNAYNIGGYNVYYSLNRSGAPYDSKATLASSVTSTVISGLSEAVESVSAPVLNKLGIGNGTLFASWSAVPAATDYLLHYTDTSIVSSATTTTIHVGNTTSYALGGLINGHYYLITVSALAQNTYFFSVTAFDSTVVGAGGGTPGVSHESNYSAEQSIPIGSTVEGPLSNSQTDFPETIIPNPDLVNNGCFIATAAYGHYSASQVQALREFRERYLLTNAPGRAFVRWYYRVGPGGAEFINAHPWLKPAVRMALMPAVGGALFMTRASALAKALTLVSAGLLVFALHARKKLLHAGGKR
ncbi:MAG TPA: CFI-box-CTERM domain-containing protein [Nitrospirota bacterium]|nr:CFI-box-CTERM domain-containing protein [Nitrospirota bacterium]